MAKKQLVRLTEGDLYKIIEESVNKILNEWSGKGFSNAWNKGMGNAISYFTDSKYRNQCDNEDALRAERLKKREEMTKQDQIASDKWLADRRGSGQPVKPNLSPEEKEKMVTRKNNEFMRRMQDVKPDYGSGIKHWNKYKA